MMYQDQSRRGFTLVELLVVIGIIALLIAILLPTLNKARTAGKTTSSLSNLRQIGLALAMYRNDNKGWFPVAAWQSLPDRPRHRWPDALHTYVRSTEIYRSPQLAEEDRSRMQRPFFHTTDGVSNPGVVAGKTVYFGGYGYNWQYLGNARETGGVRAFMVKGSAIRATDRTLAVADTFGSKNGGTAYTNEGVYVIDPPRMSGELGSNGSRKASATAGPGNYGYSGGNDGDPAHRSMPAARNNGKIACLFVDGHAETLTLKQIDDPNNDGVPDNALWNGRYDPTLR